MTLLRKSFALREAKADADARTIEGWASTFGNVDSDDDVIAPGAFAASLREKTPKMLWQHDSGQPCGVWTEARETDQGLYVKGTILDTTLGNDVHKLALAGAIDSLSIGFVTKQFTMNADTWVRTITAVDLWEVSLVTFPANSRAKLTSVKSRPETERDLEAVLRDAGYGRPEAKAIAAGGFKALAPDYAALAASLTTATNTLKGIIA